VPGTGVMYHGQKRENPSKEYIHSGVWAKPKKHGTRSWTLLPKASHCRASLWNNKEVPKPREGFDHILNKNGKKRASADVGFIFIAYNLKRILSLMRKKGFREVYAKLILCLSVLIQASKAILMALYPTDPVNPNFYPNPSLKSLFKFIIGSKLRFLDRLPLAII